MKTIELVWRSLSISTCKKTKKNIRRYSQRNFSRKLNLSYVPLFMNELNENASKKVELHKLNSTYGRNWIQTCSKCKIHKVLKRYSCVGHNTDIN